MNNDKEHNTLLAQQEALCLFAHPPAAAPQVKEATGPLAGCIVGLKANIASKGAHWSAGLAHRQHVTAETDATLTKGLQQQGATVLTGLNMDAAALGGVSNNPTFGRTANPHAPTHTAGGSSGGSAAAIAAGVLNMSVGTDTLGSIRIPASYCGVFGLKPTFGLVDRSGIVPLAPSFDVPGPMAAQAEWLWPLLKAMAGPDGQDLDRRMPPKDWSADHPPAALNTIKIGIPTQVMSVRCTPSVQNAFDKAQTILKRLGATLMVVPMPRWDPALLRKQAFLITEAEGALVYADALETSGMLPPLTEKLLAYGRDASSARLVKAWQTCRATKAQILDTLQNVDVLLMPTTPQQAFPHEQNAPANQADFTVLANVAGLPAISLPVWQKNDPLPIGLQFVGPAWSEQLLISLATQLHSEMSA